MTEAKPPIFGTAYAAWRDFFAAVVAMPRVGAVAFVVIFFVSSMNFFLEEVALADAEASWRWQLLRIGVAALSSYLLTPLGITLYRYVLIGEITERYDLRFSNPRFRTFFAYSLVTNISLALFIFLDPLVAGVLSLLLGLVLFANVIILFPAIAVDAPGVNFWNAVRDTHFWRALFILIAANLPPLLLLVTLVVFRFDPTSNTGLNWIADMFFFSVIEFAFVAANVVAAPLYLAWAIRLRGL